MLRLSGRWRDWGEHLDLDGADWTLGRDPGCAVRVQHPSVGATHAELLRRRDRVLLRPAGPQVVLLDNTPISAPVALRPGQTFRIGDVVLSAGPRPGPPRAAIEALVGALRREWQGVGAARRFEAEAGDEVYWAAARPADPEARPLAGGWCWRRALPPGVRLGALLTRIGVRDIALPAEVAVVIVAQLGAALTARHGTAGAHGALGPEAVQLGIDGQVVLVDPLPGVGADEEYMSPERRYGAAPTRADDAFAFASLGLRLLRLCEAPPAAWSPLTPLLQSNPQRRSIDVAGASAALRSRAEAGGLDATARHVAAPVRLLAAERATPLLAGGAG